MSSIMGASCSVGNSGLEAVTLRRSFRIAALRAPRGTFICWNATVRNKLEIDDLMKTF